MKDANITVLTQMAATIALAMKATN